MKSLSLESKFFIFYTALSTLNTYFAHWYKVPELNVEKLRKEFTNSIKNTKNRYDFYLVMSCMLAKLNNRHTFYYDDKVKKSYGMDMGFSAIYHDKLKKWIVVSSSNSEVHMGSIITKVNGIKTDTFFNKQKKYISASNERSARNNLFSFCSYLPLSIKIELDYKQIVSIKRTKFVNVRKEEVSYKILKNNVGYIKIPSFEKPKYENAAITYLNKFKKFRTIIIDLRNNYGGGTPRNLLKQLMNKTWEGPIYLEVITPTALENQSQNTKYHNKKKYLIEKGTVYKKNSYIHKNIKKAYKGKLIVLTNESTLSAAEDFLIPLKYTKRAVILGSRTSGSDGDILFHKFEDNILLGVGCVSVRFPNGKKIEGVGIIPDIEIYPSITDIKNNTDVVLNKALEIAIK